MAFCSVFPNQTDKQSKSTGMMDFGNKKAMEQNQMHFYFARLMRKPFNENCTHTDERFTV
jgi:hypothetical protein